MTSIRLVRRPALDAAFDSAIAETRRRVRRHLLLSQWAVVIVLGAFVALTLVALVLMVLTWHEAAIATFGLAVGMLAAKTFRSFEAL